jgi:hypothetical protein
VWHVLRCAARSHRGDSKAALVDCNEAIRRDPRHEPSYLTRCDGKGRNGPFAEALVKHTDTPGLEINLLFRKVRDEVLRMTERRQEPHVYGSLSAEELFFRAK